MNERLDEIRARLTQMGHIYHPPLVDAMRDDLRDLLAEVERLRETVADYERGIDWSMTCINCARLMDKNYEEYVRAESAEAEVATLRATLQRQAEARCPDFDGPRCNLHCPEDDR